MKFAEAFKAMKQGSKIKLPSWGGYWCWDPENETIMMHCRPQDTDKGQGPVLDIRETQRVEYTLQNILSDDWQIADEINTPVLGGEATFSFSDAIKYLKRGMKVARKGWNGKGMYLFLCFPASIEPKASNVEIYSAQQSIAMRTADSSIVVGWVASQTDMLADDWVFVD